MFYTIIKQWKTLNGEYHSLTVDKNNYDSAIGEYHSMFKPMQNDSNVEYFRLAVINEDGVEVDSCRWLRHIEPTEAEL